MKPTVRGREENSDEIITLWFSIWFGFNGVFQNAISAIAQGLFGDKIEVDQEASQACQLGGLLMAAGSKSQDKSIYRFDSAVLKTDELVTLVQLTGLNGKFLKLRYTLLDTPSSEGLNACIEGSKALREVYDLTKSRANDS